MDNQKIIEKARKIKLIVSDVDGALTDGFVYYSEKGEELKRFSLRDGMGVELLRKAEIPTAIITSESSGFAAARAKKLKIDRVVLGSRNKKSSLEELARDLKLELEQIAYFGDDVNDELAIKAAGLGGCPSDSAAAIKKVADYVCRAGGGAGAFREFAELIITAQNKSVTLPENW